MMVGSAECQHSVKSSYGRAVSVQVRSPLALLRVPAQAFCNTDMEHRSLVAVGWLRSAMATCILAAMKALIVGWCSANRTPDQDRSWTDAMSMYTSSSSQHSKPSQVEQERMLRASTAAVGDIVAI